MTGRGAGGRGRGASPAPAGRGVAGRGGKPFGGHRGGGGGYRPAPAPPAPAQKGALLPFSAKERSASECVVRSGKVPEDLTLLTAHWTETKASAALSRAKTDFTLKAASVADTTVKPAAKEEVKPGGVSVRAFLAGPIGGGGRGHVLYKMPVVAGRCSETGEMAAYGGGVAKGKSDAAMVTALKKMVKEQSGLDLAKVKTWDKLVQLDYGASGSTVFFAPNLSEAGGELVAASQANESTEEYEDDEQYEEEVEEEVEVEEEKDGKKEKVKKMQKKTVKKTRKVKKTMVNKDVVVKAMNTTVGALTETQVSKSTAKGTSELVSAAAAYDEWLQRDAATAVVGVLKKKTAEEEKKKKEREERQAEVESRKRKREEAVSAVKKVRADQEEKLRAEWKEEDEGMTDEEKKQAKQPRADAVSKLLKEMKEGIVKVNTDMDAEVEAATKAKEPAVDPSKPKTRTVWETDRDTYNLFQLLDRPQDGLRSTSERLDRDYLARKLLCLEAEPASLKDARALATFGGNQGGALNYFQISKVSKQVEIPVVEPSPKEENDEKKEDETAES